MINVEILKGFLQLKFVYGIIIFVYNIICRNLAATDEPWDDLVVEFEEGEVFYCFVYRDNHWQRWPV